MKVLCGLAAGAAALGVCASAQAGDWTVTLGGRMSLAPPYEGASQMTPFGYPTINLRRAGTPARFAAPDDGGRLTLFREGPVAFGAVARVRGKRNSKGDRVGLDSVAWALEPGAFVEVWPTSWLRLQAQGRKGVRGHHGWVGDLSADAVYDVGRIQASIGPRVGFGDSRYMETYFGVTPAEAAASPIIDTAYKPSGGMRYVGATASLTYRLGEHWRTRVFGGYNRLTKIAADSPIVRQIGSRDQFSTGVGLSYAFNVHF